MLLTGSLAPDTAADPLAASRRKAPSRLRLVEIQSELMRAAARWTMALKLASVFVGAQGDALELLEFAEEV
jgi:hypothetical protein